MVCAGTIAGLATGLILAASDPVVIGTDAPFPSYTFVDANGTITGFERDLMDEVCLRARLDCTWELANFDELIPGVMSGRFDVVLGGIAVTDARRQLVDFTVPYHSTDPEEWYIGLPGAPAPSRAVIAVQSGTVHEAHLRDLGFRHVSLATEPEVLDALREGTVDLAFGPFQTRDDVADFMGTHGIEFLYSDMLPDDGVGMAVCKGNADLLGALDAALAAMRSDGTLALYETRWFE
jgi:polar amino acid transport system substrate-binding protein